jgi:hypothetical protein
MAQRPDCHAETLEVDVDQPGHVATIVREFFLRRAAAGSTGRAGRQRHGVIADRAGLAEHDAALS